ncbi:LysR substrate-binding domain-containing protein [Conexibacter stalactiti]|uniref:LysR substrate-binding domain-containing protein n=1 Tax=Conexibacter stalactiti TaxID=1940611 RepID=A0ABU4HNV1_9ACTN|nr:LysR substrate-binding domain-containing protein [Conexibacter stalactiti]MDW5594985.1 LysR substrate-binding domain-containing protein [Conexibacter stalactiti]MEC5035627.1 LysR substrate-binding domain-containing protein [Conexibacter stalactiti]
MELRQLEYFVAVAETASFTQAAAALHVAQPGVSAQVRRLEAELGHELFDRSGRRVRLTAVGEAVLPRARAALEAVAGVREAVDELAGLLRGSVAVGIVPGGPAGFVSDLLGRFNRAHPAVDVTLTEGNSDTLLARLLDGQIDLAVAALAGPPPAGAEVATLLEEPLVAAVAPGHPLVGRGAIALVELAGLPLISLPRGSGLRSAFDAGCAAAGMTPRIAFEASDPAVLVQLARRGLGIAILPRVVAVAPGSELHAIAIGTPRLHARMELAWRAHGPASPAARALIELARAAAPAAGAASAGAPAPGAAQTTRKRQAATDSPATDHDTA